MLAQMNGPRWSEVGGPAIRATLTEPETLSQLALAQKLVTLRTDAPLDFTEIFEERAVAPLVEVETDPMTIDDDSDLDEVFGESAPEKSAPEQPEVVTRESTPPPPAPAPQRPAPPPVQMGAPGNGNQQIGLAGERTSIVQVPYEHQLEPRSPGAAMTLAEWIHNSRLYQRFSSREAIFAVVVRGREMGLGAMTALDCFHVIEGKPAMHAHLIIARAMAHPDCEYFQMVECDATSVTYETKKRQNPKPTRITYRLQDAQIAGLCPITMRTQPVRSDKGKDIRGNWEKRPAEMLRKTCGVQLARIEYPDAVMGLYSIEELEESA
jgi:hypothetical protein